MSDVALSPELLAASSPPGTDGGGPAEECCDDCEDGDVAGIGGGGDLAGLEDLPAGLLAAIQDLQRQLEDLEQRLRDIMQELGAVLADAVEGAAAVGDAPQDGLQPGMDGFAGAGMLEPDPETEPTVDEDALINQDALVNLNPAETDPLA